VQQVAQPGGGEVGFAEFVEALAEPGVAVVEADDAQALGQQPLHQLVGPGHQLHAQAHHQQHGLGAGRALVVDLQRRAVGRHQPHQCDACSGDRCVVL
jgi:hypothetical protein